MGEMCVWKMLQIMDIIVLERKLFLVNLETFATNICLIVTFFCIILKDDYMFNLKIRKVNFT